MYTCWLLIVRVDSFSQPLNYYLWAQRTLLSIQLLRLVYGCMFSLQFYQLFMHVVLEMSMCRDVFITVGRRSRLC
jgi:hypothetical protein